MSASPRLIALDGLSQIIGEGRMLSDVMSDDGWSDLSPSERATAQRLMTETLRYLGRADHVLAPFLQRPPLGNWNSPAVFLLNRSSARRA